MEYYKMTDFCCIKMKQEQKDLKDKYLKDHSVIGDKAWRYYCIYFNEETRPRIGDLMSDIYHCPWCGEKFLKGLSGEWFDILEQEYNILDPSDKDRKRVPPEFKTDEWWKKRGL